MKFRTLLTLLLGCMLASLPVTAPALAHHTKSKPAAKTTEQAPAAAPLLQGRWQPTAKINLAWDHIYQGSANQPQPNKIEGLDVVSPTWFAVIDGTGLVRSSADAAYVKDAHAKGYKVWALVTNSFNPELTHQILASDAAQDTIAKQLLQYAQTYQLDGINIDFENMYDYDKDKFASFVEKLSKILRAQNLIVSIDITIPSATPNWSKCYDRQRLGAAVDYVMLMTYDEHWSKSPKSGSVASLPWVEAGVKNTLAFIPKEKLLLGIPFYTREWEETTDEWGKKTVKAKTMSMAAVQKTIDAYNLHPVWLPDLGQYYVEYEKNDAIYKIWIEDAQSIALKAELIQKYDLAGAASWRKGFEANQIWNVLNNALRPE